MSDVTVIGGGIIGICSAIALQDEGFAVELVDRGVETEAASYGNCGLLAAGEIVPISKPGILQKIPKWLSDPKSPLFVRPKDMIGQMPWLLRFLWSGRRSRVLEIVAGMTPLLSRAEDDYRALLQSAGLSDKLVTKPNIMAFNSKADIDADSFTWDLRVRHGFKHRFLDSKDLKAIEPALSGPITCGLLLEDWLQFSDPGIVRNKLAEFFQTRGGFLRKGSVTNLVTQGGRVSAIRLSNGEQIAVKRIVLAAGAWSAKLARDLGIKVPLAALQGYHHHLPNPNVKVNHAILYSNGGFVLTPMESGLRIGGTIEVAGLDPKPNFERANIIAEKAKAVLPGLDIIGGKQWMGPRPFMPDTMPVIDRATDHANVVMAFGHGQVGMTLGATTGKLVADLVTCRKSSLDLTPYKATRFSLGQKIPTPKEGNDLIRYPLN
ncbi:FAD-dependent oxidoreductase (plasmid) [Rhizobium sp. CB3090]|uniref:NAD(P)/FAD-dependent oxidoreductase n=1 Tax=Rhizobium sp. CB3090 TaxID=3039156 RepID=UPI0024B1FA78|nr:FAD-dependent oxidoreductase [Rhizobium sp. CB3090]WFU11769.1 FAD-dependent oxidoreductase [Rhizobium sp. CB3090]